MSLTAALSLLVGTVPVASSAWADHEETAAPAADVAPETPEATEAATDDVTEDAPVVTPEPEVEAPAPEEVVEQDVATEPEQPEGEEPEVSSGTDPPAPSSLLPPPTLNDVEDGPIVAPLASATSSDIRITARAHARPSGNNSTQGLGTPTAADIAAVEGATYALYLPAYNTNGSVNGAAGPQGAVVPGSTVGWPAGSNPTCTIAAGASSCIINVPNTNLSQANGGNQGKQFWVVQTAEGAGTYFNDALTVGDYQLNNPEPRFLVGLTRNTWLQPNGIYDMPRTGAEETQANSVSFAAVAEPLDNPQPTPVCEAPLSIAVIMDLSASVSTSQRNTFRNSLVGTGGLLDSLKGTQATVAVFSFGEGSPAGGRTNYPNPLVVAGSSSEVTSPAGGTQAAGLNQALINQFNLSTSGTQYTNWDAGFRAVANAATTYDIALFITDGAPNYMWNGTGGNTSSLGGVSAGAGNDISIRALQAGIWSANAVKAEDTRIVGIGVGNAINAPEVLATNIRAVTGDDRGSYYGAEDWDALTEQLVEIAQGLTCQVPLTVTKNVLNAQGQNPTPDAGWDITATLDGPAAATPPDETQQTDGNGEANWLYQFTTTAATASLTVSENAASKPGYSAVGATCTVTHNDDTTTEYTVSAGVTEIDGIDVHALDKGVDCVFNNRPNIANVVIQKVTDVASDDAFPFVSGLPTNGTFSGGAGLIDGGFELPNGGSYSVQVAVDTIPADGISVTEDFESADWPEGWRLQGVTCSTVNGIEFDDAGIVINSLTAGQTLTCTFTNTNAAPSWTAWKLSGPAGSNTADNPTNITEVLPDGTIIYYLYAKNDGNRPVQATLTDNLQISDENGVLQYATPIGFEDGTVTPQGSSGVPATQVVLVDRSDPDGDANGATVPDEESDIPLNERGTVTFDEASGELVWDIEELPVGGFLRLSFPVKVNSDAFGAQLHNQLTAAGDIAPLECAEGSNGGARCNTWHETPVPSWTIAKTASPASGSEVEPGTVITYTVTARNFSTIPVTGITLTDDLTQVLDNATFVEGSVTWGTISPPTAVQPAPTAPNDENQLVAQIDTLGGLQQVSLEYQVRVNDHAYGVTINNAVAGKGTPVPPEDCTPEEPCETTHETGGPPHLKLVKEVTNQWGGTSVATDWTLSATADVVGAPTLEGAGTVEADVWSGVTYQLDESSAVTGYEVATDWICEGTGEFYPDPDSNTVDLEIDADVTCTIVNRDTPALLTLVKELPVPNSGAVSDWTLTAAGPTSGVSGVTGEDAVTARQVVAGTYELSESGPAGFSASDWTCVVTGTDTAVDVVDGSVSVAVGDDVTCTIQNTPVPVLIDKGYTGSSQDEDGVWTVTYDITVTNGNDSAAAVYSLSDTLSFGDGIEITAAEWTGPADLAGSWENLPDELTAVLATDRTLAADSSETYTVTVTATIPPASWAGQGQLECATEENPEGGGFLNEATVTYPGGEATDEDCGTPTRPTIVKAFVSSTQSETDPLEWSVAYTITVTGGDQDTFYDLADVPGFPEGVTLKSGVATLDDESWDIPPAGGTFRTGVAIAAGATHVYDVVWTVEIAEPIPGDQATCTPGEPGNGFFNEAAMTVAGDDIDTEACGPITSLVLPTVGKSVTSTVQNPDGTWTIVYGITVALPTGELNPEGLSATYDLTDEIRFGGDIVVNSAAWTGPTEGDFEGTTATLAEGKVITPVDTPHEYTVTVNATVNTEAFSNQTAQCEAEVGEEGSGFLNTATLTAGGSSTQSWDCSEPVAPQVQKTGQAAVQNPDGTWAISYELTVTNPGDKATVFTLTDSPADLPAGVALAEGTTWTAEGTDVVEAQRPETGDWTIASGTLQAGSSLSYQIRATVTVSVLEENAEIGQCEDVEGVGIVLPNGSTVTSGGFQAEDDGCTTVPPAPELTVAKSHVSSTQGTDGVWTVVYDVVVTNLSPDYLGTYSLTDTIRFGGGITVEGATWTGPTGEGSFGDAATATLATDRVLAAGGTETYTVTVQATIPGESWAGEGQLECTGENGTDGGGFLNEASVTFPGGSASDEDCDTPTRPTVLKEFVSATQSADDPLEWAVAYTITVTGGEHDTTYDLADVPGFPPGVTLKSGVATLGDESWDIPPAGGMFRTDVAIPAGETHVYQVVWTVEIAAPIPGNQATCEPGAPGSGFFNEATMTVAGADIDTEACGPIDELVVPTVDKSVTSTVQNPDGTWTIVYGVTVTLPTGELNPKGLSAKYDLTDEIRFGGDIVVNSATWTGPTTGEFDGTTATLASGVAISPQDNPHEYVVTVNATVNTEAFTNQTAQCEAEVGEEGSGFLNTAALTSGGVTHESWDCSEPVAPTLEKTGQAATQNADDSWEISYVLTVTNPAEPGAPAVEFVLTDTPADLPEGVTLADGAAWVAEALEDAPAVAQAERPATGDWTIATGSLEAGTSASYLVSTTVNVELLDEHYEFGQCEDVDGEGIVLPNGSTVVSGGFEASDDGCTTVLPPQSWTLTKGSDPVSGSTVEPGSTVSYTLTVTNTGQVPVEGATAVDDLSGVLQNAVLLPVDDENVSIDTDTGLLTWTVPVVAPGASVTLTYQVTVNSDAYGVTLRNVVTPEGPGGECVPAEGEDELCETEHHTPAWTIKKESDPVSGSTVVPGQDVVYTLTVQNVSDAVVENKTAIDDLSDVLDNATLDLISIEGKALTFDEAAETLTWAIPTLQPGESATVTYTVTVNDDAIGVWLRNVVTSPGSVPCVPEEALPGGDSLMQRVILAAAGDVNDEELCPTSTEHPTPAWTLVKGSDPVSGSTVLPGDSIEYTLTAANTSDAVVEGAVAIDDLSNVLNNAALVEPLADGLVLDGTTLTWTIPTLEPGASAEVSYTVTVNEDAVGVTIGNVVTGEGPVPPEECVPVEGEDEDCRSTEHYTPEWTLSKASDPVSGSTVLPGDSIEYTLTAANTSDAVVEGAKAVDNLAKVLDNATLSTPLAEGLDLEGMTLTWAIPTLQPGDVATVSYTVTVNDGAYGVTVANVVTPEGPGGECVPVEGEDENCETVHSTPQWTLEKHSDPKSGSKVKAGDTVTYTLTARNTSDVDIEGAKAIDNMSQVLNNARLVTPLAQGLVLDGTTLTWSIPTLAPGEFASISYKVVVKDYKETITLKNVVAPSGPGGECVPGLCTTTHPGGGLSVTGAAIGSAVGIAVGLMLVGGAALFYTKRRKERGTTA